MLTERPDGALDLNARLPVADFEKRPADHPLARRHGFDSPFFEARYDFVLEQN